MLIKSKILTSANFSLISARSSMVNFFILFKTLFEAIFFYKYIMGCFFSVIYFFFLSRSLSLSNSHIKHQYAFQYFMLLFACTFLIRVFVFLYFFLFCYDFFFLIWNFEFTACVFEYVRLNTIFVCTEQLIII